MSGVPIHARAKRATSASPYRGTVPISFQFTPARSGRPPGGCKKSGRVAVPIHARAKRATAHCAKSSRLRSGSNSRPREAGDCFPAAVCRTSCWFQFTPARSGRHPEVVTALNVEKWFQFTPARSGRPIAADDARRQQTVPIHARAKRATFSRYELRTSRQFVPIHARAKRATSHRFRDRPQPWGFQFTPARSGRPRRIARTIGPLNSSNSRPREAGDCGASGPRYARSWFQFTPARSGRRGGA